MTDCQKFNLKTGHIIDIYRQMSCTGSVFVMIQVYIKYVPRFQDFSAPLNNSEFHTGL